MNEPARHRSRPRRRRGRTSQRRPERTAVLIVCEGRETERNYLDELKREDAVRQRFTVRVVGGRGGSRRQIVQRAIDRKNDRRNDIDDARCVMDVESLGSEEARNDLKAAIQMAADNDISICLSNPAFEVWFLSHFVRTSRCFNDCAAVIAELDEHWKQAFGCDYRKNDRRIYFRMRDRTDAAIANARAVREQDHEPQADTAECNSSTEVYRLVEYLLR